MNNKKTSINKKNEKKSEFSPIDKKVVKNSLNSNFDIDLVEGAEAYYSERYGWTLRKSK
tara:strand:+ start:194 stop:370 length:177 start_codon:yes stop_codon:yes gene_type:complete